MSEGNKVILLEGIVKEKNNRKKSGHNDIEKEEGKILFQSLIDFDFSFPEFYGSFHANRHAILNNNCQESPALLSFSLAMVSCFYA